MSNPLSSLDTVDILAVDATVQRASGDATYGVTASGFVPKPFQRVLAEKLALARNLFGDDLDVSPGSMVRKLLELSALEDARTWAALSEAYDDGFVATARGEALSRLGEAQGYPRPYLRAAGKVTLELVGTPPTGSTLALPHGARLLSPGGHEAFLAAPVVLSAATTSVDVPVEAFHPGPEHDLDPKDPGIDGSFPERLDRFHPLDPRVRALAEAAEGGTPIVKIVHTAPLNGGSLRWPDDRYRSLLLGATGGIWSAEALHVATSLVPGVRAVRVRDPHGGLDLEQSVFGTFRFVERLFGAERDLTDPYFVSVLVAPTSAALWEGPTGLRERVREALAPVRPAGVHPRIVRATDVAVGVRARLVVSGLPLPRGATATIQDTAIVRDLKRELLARLRAHLETLGFGEPVRASQITWILLDHPAVVDVVGLELLRYPAPLHTLALDGTDDADAPEAHGCGGNLAIGPEEVPVFVDRADLLTVVRGAP